VDEVKTWADKAAAMQAGQMANDKRLEVDAAEIRIRAEPPGELIAAQKATVGLNTGTAGIGKSALVVTRALQTQLTQIWESATTSPAGRKNSLRFLKKSSSQKWGQAA
jgi:hypothetical protein